MLPVILFLLRVFESALCNKSSLALRLPVNCDCSLFHCALLDCSPRMDYVPRQATSSPHSRLMRCNASLVSEVQMSQWLARVIISPVSSMSLSVNCTRVEHVTVKDQPFHLRTDESVDCVSLWYPSELKIASRPDSRSFLPVWLRKTCHWTLDATSQIPHPWEGMGRESLIRWTHQCWKFRCGTRVLSKKFHWEILLVANSPVFSCAFNLLSRLLLSVR